jgi:hypothetical protein
MSVSNLDAFKITFDTPVKTEVVKYPEAKLRSKFLTDEEEICGFCQRIFKENHDVALFGCGHALHHKCLNSMESAGSFKSDVCPFDNKNFNSCKAHLAGRSIEFYNRTIPLGKYLIENQESINAALYKKFNGNEEQLEKFAESAIPLVDVFIKSLEHNFTDLQINNYADSIIYYINELTEEFDTADFNFDAFKTKQTGLNPLANKILSFLVARCKMDRTNIYLTSYFDLFEKIEKKLAESPLYDILAAKMDKHFLEHHLNEIREFHSQDKTYHYLNALDKDNFERLARVVTGEDECSLEIKSQIAKIKLINAAPKIIMKLAYSGVMGAAAYFNGTFFSTSCFLLTLPVFRAGLEDLFEAISDK